MPEQVHCPSCSAPLRVPDTLLGKNVKCPKCQTTFIAETNAPAEPEEGIVSDSVPSSGVRRRPLPPEDLDDEGPPPGDEPEDEDRPRRRRGRRGRISADVESAVAGPAIALMVVGGIDIALGILNLILNLTGVGVGLAAPGGARGGDPNMVAQAMGGVFGSIMDVVMGAIIISGAGKMKQLNSYGFAMTACILSMLPCFNCCCLGLGFGIWGLVVLNKPEVKEAFT